MRISVSTIFQVIALIAQDVLAFEAKQTASTSGQPLTSETPATDSQTLVK
ncbi:MAG: hypothetical protein V7L04_31725 [Nostoc sp.]